MAGALLRRAAGALVPAPVRRWALDARAAALERRVRAEPAAVAPRRAAAAHYCRRLEALADEGAIAASGHLELAREHLERVLEATDDIDELHGTLSSTLGARLFYHLPELTAKYMRRIGLHQECLEEFDTRSEFEERATCYHLANALAVLKAANRWQAARELFEEAVALEWRGRRPVKWQRLEQTPAVYVDGLEHRPFWDGGDRLPLAELLEESWPQLREDLGGLRERRMAWAAGQVAAYPNLLEGGAAGGGAWDMLQLYSGRRWHEDACELAPRAAELLRGRLPSADCPYVHYNTEEVVLFLLTPGSRVRLHNGGSNVPVNVGLGLDGCTGAGLEVAGEERSLRDGAAVCFDDGTDHRVWHTGAEERWVLTVRVMHPQLAADPGRYFARAFTRRTCFESWGEERAARLRGAER